MVAHGQLIYCESRDIRGVYGIGLMYPQKVQTAVFFDKRR